MQIFVYAPGIPLCFGSNTEKKNKKGQNTNKNKHDRITIMQLYTNDLFLFLELRSLQAVYGFYFPEYLNLFYFFPLAMLRLFICSYSTSVFLTDFKSPLLIRKSVFTKRITQVIAIIQASMINCQPAFLKIFQAIC